MNDTLGFSSTFSLPTVTLPAYSVASASTVGPSRLHGPHHSAQKSTSTGAADYAGKVTVGKLNVDDNPNTAFRFQVRGIPTLLLFKGGQVVESVVGLVQKDDLKKVIDKHI